MTTKRFIIDDAGSLIDMRTRETYDYVSDVYSVLNELNDENEQLKQALRELKEIGDYQADRIKELGKKNMEYYHLINCGKCKYHNWDWYDDGDEFEVCEKGNTERLMYHRFCKEWRRD